MNNSITLKPISIGYNNDLGQEYFDLLNQYKQHLHSFFFSIFERYGKRKDDKYIDPEEMIERIKHLDTYDIPGNLLFNNRSINEYESSIEYIDKLSNIINLSSVTIVNPLDGKIIKESFPHLERHLSIHYFDGKWSKLQDINGNGDYFIDELHKLQGYIDVVNLSGSFHYNSHKVIKTCRELGFKVKYIVNEGCIVHQHINYSNFPECENLSCHSDDKTGCTFNCMQILSKHPWMELCCTYMPKEYLQFIDIDIIKLSARSVTDINEIQQMLYEYTSSRCSDHVGNVAIQPTSYDIFMEYLENKSLCKLNCYQCMKCKEYYDQIILNNKLMSI